MFFSHIFSAKLLKNRFLLDLDHRSEAETVRHGWVKVHIITGVRTNVIPRAVISPSAHHDNPYFPELVTNTVQHGPTL